MEISNENEKTELKPSNHNLKVKSEIKKTILKEKEKIIFFAVTFFFLILSMTIIIYLISNSKWSKKMSFNKKVFELNEQNKILEGKNNFIKNEYENLKNKGYSNNSKIVAISYGNNNFRVEVQFNKKSALEIAEVDEFYVYGPEDIEPEFKKKNEYILSNSKGNGYWLWKPYFILKTLKNKLNDGDYLIYSDAGILYINKAQLIIDFLKERKAEIYFYRLPFLEKYYTKRDAFILLGADSPFFTETGQFNAAFQVYKKSKFTEIFLEEYLNYAQDKRIITDDENIMGFPNYKGFTQHRHDQSILSILAKKYIQFNDNKMNIEIIKNNTELMPTIFCHYRRQHFDNYEEIIKFCKGMNANL